MLKNKKQMGIKYVSVFILISCMFISCGDDENNPSGSTEIRLSTSAKVTLRAGNGAPDTQIAANQQVGVYITENGGSNTQIAVNEAYTTDGYGGLAGPLYYYPESDNPVNIQGYYPYNNGSTDSYTFTVQSDQSADNDYYISDLLYCSPILQTRTKDVVELVFEHKLSKITYTLKNGNNIQPGDLDDAVVKILKLKPETTFNRLTGVITVAAGTAVDIILHETYGAVIIPQQVAESENLLEVELQNGKRFYAKVETAGGITFEGGRSYHYNITVNQNSLDLELSVSDWSPDIESEDGDLE